MRICRIRVTDVNVCRKLKLKTCWYKALIESLKILTEEVILLFRKLDIANEKIRLLEEKVEKLEKDLEYHREST
jgi:hypothetical protein